MACDSALAHSTGGHGRGGQPRVLLGGAQGSLACVNEYKQSNEVPEAMQLLYDYLHDRQIKWAAKIKAKQEQFK